MRKEELIQRSPVRGVEKIIHGALQTGEVGVVASASGLGKTSVLVQLALDKLLQGKKVIHVSFTQQKSYVLSWYEDIFGEFVQKKNLENAAEVREEVMRNRVLLNFNQDGVTSDTIRASLKALIVDGGFNAESIIIDGFDFAKASRERVGKLRDFARETGVSLWYSCNIGEGGCDEHGIPRVLSGVADFVDVVILLDSQPDYIRLSVPKNRAGAAAGGEILKLDPRTLLILDT